MVKHHRLPGVSFRWGGSRRYFIRVWSVGKKLDLPLVLGG